MTPTLEELASCFQGLIPSMFFTCAADGTPNAAYLSHVDYVDGRHVALSFQFFNKSRRNVAENPNALVRVIDPDTQQGWALRLRYVRSETAGPIFDRMYLRIEAIASYCSMKGIFKLRAADLYEVVSITAVPEERGVAGASGTRRIPDPVFTMRALQDLALRLNTASSVEQLVDSILQGLDDHFGFTHSLIQVPGERPGTLITVASRGYAENGAGAESRFGEGITGMVAEARQPIRISGLLRGMLYAYATAHRANEPGWAPPERQIPMPGLPNPASQLGVPLLVRGELVGVLCLESDVPYRFHEEDRATVELLGSFVAIALQNALLQESAESQRAEAVPATEAPRPAPVPAGSSGPTREVAYYAADECVMVDGEYLIRGLPARILAKLLRAHARDGRSEFTNRELRLDKSLQLPELKDNLETRLLLLRRRLEQKTPEIRLVPRGRGRFGLELAVPVAFVERP